VADKFHIEKLKVDGYQWLMPVILAIWEGKIRRIEVQGQPRQIVF
jgi:hypothetical protein